MRQEMNRRVDADGDAAAPPIPNTANMLGQAGHAMECGAEAITANGRAPKAEDGCAAGNAEGMGKKARMANPEPECKPKHAADGPWIVSKKPLIVRRYDPVASAVVRRVDGVSVLPNFKRFQKARGLCWPSTSCGNALLLRLINPASSLTAGESRPPGFKHDTEDATVTLCAAHSEWYYRVSGGGKGRDAIEACCG